jgi:serine/threonine protein kinase
MSDFVMMKELAFQYYAKNLSEDHRKCNFKVPEIISYGRLALTNPYEHNEILKSEKYKIYGPYNCFWFIEMEKMSYGTLNKYLKDVNLNNQEICDALSEKLIELDTCLKKNDLYHNDYHGDNVFYNPVNGEIGLIDYGISNFEGILGTNPSVDYTCDTLKQIQKTLEKNLEKKHIGGKKYRTRKYKSRKYRTRKCG